MKIPLQKNAGWLHIPVWMWLAFIVSVGVGFFCSILEKQLAVQLTIILSVFFPALILAETDSKWLIPYILFVWAVNPEIRRLFEWYHNEYHPVSLFSVLPLLVTLSVVIPILRRRWAMTPVIRNVLILFLIALIYGLAIGMIRNGFASLFDFANYIVPLLFLVYAELRSHGYAERRLWMKSFVNIALLVAVYGIIQFFVVPPWDAFWMNEVEMSTNGLPLPYEIRVFSSLNSPGPAGMFMSVALLAMLVEKEWRGFMGWLGVPVMALGLIITLVRASWVTMVVALLLYLMLSNAKRRAQGLLLICAIAILGVGLIPVVPGGDKLVERFQSLGNINDDYSYNDRMEFTANMIPKLLGNPFGEGLGSVGTGTKLENGGQLGQYGNFDNGFFALFLTFGIFGAIVFFRAIWLYAKQLFRWHKTAGQADQKYVRLALCVLVSAVCYLTFENRMSGIGAAIVWFVAALGMKPLPAIERIEERK